MLVRITINFIVLQYASSIAEHPKVVVVVVVVVTLFYIDLLHLFSSQLCTYVQAN